MIRIGQSAQGGPGSLWSGWSWWTGGQGDLGGKWGKGDQGCPGLAHSCTRFTCYLGMEIYAKTQWTTTKIVELGNQCKDPMNNKKDCRVG